MAFFAKTLLSGAYVVLCLLVLPPSLLDN
jgi:hypothetical protein